MLPKHSSSNVRNTYNSIRIRKSCCWNTHVAMLEINSNVLSLHSPKSAQSVIIYWLHDLGLQYYCNDIISYITCDTLKQERIILSLIGVRLMVIVSRETGESNLLHIYAAFVMDWNKANDNVRGFLKLHHFFFL